MEEDGKGGWKKMVEGYGGRWGERGEGRQGNRWRKMGGGYGEGGFNVSNLMRIKRRMIDIGKKKTFYFIQNV
jgi:hypothetical protein